MAKIKTELDKAVDRAAKLIQAQLDNLPVEVARKKVRELQEIAAKAYRSAESGSARPSRRTGAIPLSNRSRAKTA